MRSFFTCRLRHSRLVAASTFVATSADAQQPFPQPQFRRSRVPPQPVQPQAAAAGQYQPYPQQPPPGSTSRTRSSRRPASSRRSRRPAQPAIRRATDRRPASIRRRLRIRRPASIRPAQPPPPSDKRDAGEMTALYVDDRAVGHRHGHLARRALQDRRIPASRSSCRSRLGAAAPIGAYLWDDQGGPLHRGVPASISRGPRARRRRRHLDRRRAVAVQPRRATRTGRSPTQTTRHVDLRDRAAASAAGPSAKRCDPIRGAWASSSSGAGWGALSGVMLGIAVERQGLEGRRGRRRPHRLQRRHRRRGRDQPRAHAVVAVAEVHVARLLVGALVGCLVFPLYLFSDADPKHGFIGPALGGLAGVGVAGALTWDLQGPRATSAARPSSRRSTSR